MIEIKAKLKIARAAYTVEVKGRLELPFDVTAMGVVMSNQDELDGLGEHLPFGSRGPGRSSELVVGQVPDQG